MVDLILPKDLKEEIKRFHEAKAEACEWELADLMACKSLEDWRNLSITSFQDDKTMRKIQIWKYFQTPIMQCKVWMDTKERQLKFQIERISDEKIIT